MAGYDPVTYADFIARFPAFTATDENGVLIFPQTMVEEILAEAMTQVDDSWIEADYGPAVKYLTAHLLTVEGAGGERAAKPGVIASESFGPMSVSYAVTPSGSAAGDYSSTVYGQRFARLRAANFPGVTVV